MKANKYKLKPTQEQREKIAIQFGCARFIFNDGLAKKKQFWDSGAYTITRYELQSMLVGMKKDKDTQWLKIETHVGLDMGIIDFVTMSHGTKITNPRFVNRQLKNLRRKQQQLSRKKKGSANYKKSTILVAKLHKKVKDARNDFQHTLSFNLANKNHVVSIEDINMSGLSKNHKLARHLLDLGWFDFTQKLQYKQDDRGHYLSKIDRFYASSKTCFVCHHKVDSLPLGIREWACSSCGTVHDRDENAAMNVDKQGIIKIKADGITVSACGDFNVSRVTMNSQTSMKQEAPFIVRST
jgi:putative transposase